MSDATDRVLKTAEQLGEQAAEVGDDLYELGQRATTTVRKQVVGEPWLAVGLAFSFGAALGFTLARTY